VSNLATVLDDSPVRLAPRLLGSLLVRDTPHGQIVGRIVETEAYHQSGVASHSYRGQTPRNAVMFGPAGFAYVYFTYGMHYCCNIVTGTKGEGSAVLIRALEPLEGMEQMAKNRGRDDELTNGPAKLCQALNIDKSLNGHDLSMPPLTLVLKDPPKESEVVQSTRIGISHEQHQPWRFYLKDCEFISKK